MSPRLISFSFLAFIFLSLPAVEAQSDGFTGMYPTSPKDLIKALPAKVEGWELTRSQGKTDLGLWLETLVTREFVPLQKEETSGPIPPSKVRLSILDTGGAKGTDLDLFDDFVPQVSVEGGYEYLFLSGQPAIITTLSKNEFEVQLLADDRFIISLFLAHTPRKELKTWLKRIETAKLESIPDTPHISLPDSFNSVQFNELTPGKSRNMVVGTSHEETEDSEDSEDSEESADCGDESDAE